jgi:hypothetical protein
MERISETLNGIWRTIASARRPEEFAIPASYPTMTRHRLLPWRTKQSLLSRLVFRD